MRSTPGLLLMCVCLAAQVRSDAAEPRATSKLAPGQVAFQTGFEGSNDLNRWSRTVTLGPGHAASSSSIFIRSGPDSPTTVVTTPLAADQLAGCTLRCSAAVRAQDVSSKPNPWNGIKVMLVVESPAGRTYPQAPLETGAFDWRRAAFTSKIPHDATNITLLLGLEQVTGSAWFDDVKIVVTKAPAAAASPQPAAGPMYKGHNLARLRGAMISPGIDAASLRVLGTDWNANLLRWQLIRFGKPMQSASLDDYDAWLEAELRRLDAALPLCEQNGLMVVVDLHSPPGGRGTVSGYVGSDHGLFTDSKAQEQFVALWRQIATRYQGAKAIWGFDLANEPVEEDVEEGCSDWQGLAERAARAIREVDPQRTIIVEPANWGSPNGLKDFVPLPLSNVVYSVHMYEPSAFTHQGVHQKGAACRYPGEIAGKQWSKADLETVLQPVVDFQKRYNAHIYIGEFSAIRWAPDNSAGRYLSDLIDIFEAHGWDWSYHAFREWHGWSVEHGPDVDDTRAAASPTDRQRLLCNWFARNQKPR